MYAKHFAQVLGQSIFSQTIHHHGKLRLPSWLVAEISRNGMSFWVQGYVQPQRWFGLPKLRGRFYQELVSPAPQLSSFVCILPGPVHTERFLSIVVMMLAPVCIVFHHQPFPGWLKLPLTLAIRCLTIHLLLNIWAVWFFIHSFIHSFSSYWMSTLCQALNQASGYGVTKKSTLLTPGTWTLASETDHYK